MNTKPHGDPLRQHILPKHTNCPITGVCLINSSFYHENPPENGHPSSCSCLFCWDEDTLNDEEYRKLYPLPTHTRRDDCDYTP